jgi:hypothetical protein
VLAVHCRRTVGDKAHDSGRKEELSMPKKSKKEDRKDLSKKDKSEKRDV